MKTSTKLLLVGILILVASLATYNVALRAEYNRGEFRNPYRDYSALTLRDFDEVELAPGSRLTVKIEAGPFAVRQHNKADSIQVVQTGRRLRIIDLAKQRNSRSHWTPNVVVVNCPRLAMLLVNSSAAGVAQAPPAMPLNPDLPSAVVQLNGFHQDSLLLAADQNASVELGQNQLGQLRVVAGTTPGSTANVRIAKTNTIGAARLNFQHNSAFTLDAPTISDLRYQFSDSVRATLPGAALRALARE
ncbi:hypothetical protein H8B15_17425 [Hymenobacter sp. BT507]|uniref:Auto-transporter adhesin head GIN domain-containing protein n=1 Tax=Hymenobacter citatus TaxID=2763506 RepID=A0ABR7MP19_9BACT|nr:hypothetical protein [Hymenobacter citatus]MBC6612708.1 hypothetical protein [Hymenobacter citatus]